MNKKVRGTRPQSPRLLFIAPTNDLIAGGEISHFELIKAAVNRGCRVHVVLPGDGYFANQLARRKIGHTVVPFSYWHPEIPAMDVALQDTEAILKISALIKSLQIDSVITNTLNMPWGAVAAAMTNVPHVWIAREFPLHEFKYLGDRYDFIGGFSNLVIANSKNLAKYMRDEAGLTKVKHFYSYVNADHLALDTGIKKTRVVCVGNIHSRKNQLELIRAMALVKEKYGEDYKLLIIGHAVEKPYYKNLQQEVKKTGLQNMVEFLPFSEQPWSYIRPNDVFVQTSVSESIGRSMTEAMKLGIVCIGSDIPGIREAFGLGGGILYKSGDPLDLAAKISMVLESPEKYRQQAKQAQKQASKNMSEKTAHDPFFRELDKLFGASNPRGELAHLLPLLEGEVTNHKRHLAELSIIGKENKALALHLKATDADLQNVVQSKAWKFVLHIRKVLRR